MLADDLLKGMDQIAEHIGEERRQAYYMASKGQIPVFKIGGQWRARKSELNRAFSAAGNAR